VARRYVLVCRGPNCKAQGAVEVREALRKALAESEASDVVVLPYTCFDLCGRGPNAVIYPDGQWFEALGLGDVPDLVEHLRGGVSATHLMAEVDHHHAEACYQIFDDVIPDLEAEAVHDAMPRQRGWPPILKTLFRKA